MTARGAAQTRPRLTATDRTRRVYLTMSPEEQAMAAELAAARGRSLSAHLAHLVRLDHAAWVREQARALPGRTLTAAQRARLAEIAAAGDEGLEAAEGDLELVGAGVAVPRGLRAVATPRGRRLLERPAPPSG